MTDFHSIRSNAISYAHATPTTAVYGTVTQVAALSAALIGVTTVPLALYAHINFTFSFSKGLGKRPVCDKLVGYEVNRKGRNSLRGLRVDYNE